MITKTLKIQIPNPKNISQGEINHFDIFEFMRFWMHQNNTLRPVFAGITRKLQPSDFFNRPRVNIGKTNTPRRKNIF